MMEKRELLEKSYGCSSTHQEQMGSTILEWRQGTQTPWIQPINLIKLKLAVKDSIITHVCGWAGSSPKVMFSPWISVKHLSQKWYLPARRPYLGELGHQNTQPPKKWSYQSEQSRSPQRKEGALLAGWSIDGSVWQQNGTEQGGGGRIREEGRGQTAQTSVVKCKHQDQAEQTVKAKQRVACGLLPDTEEKCEQAQILAWKGIIRTDIQSLILGQIRPCIQLLFNSFSFHWSRCWK